MSKGLSKQEARHQIKMQSEALVKALVVKKMRDLDREIDLKMRDLSRSVLVNVKLIEKNLKRLVVSSVKDTLIEYRKVPVLTKKEIESFLKGKLKVVGI